MSWTRKLSRQGNTHIVTIPLGCVESLGVKKGDTILFEQPLSRCLMMFPLDAANLATDNVRTRAFGYVVGRHDLSAIVSRWGIQESSQGIVCVGCGFHPAQYRMREVHVCRYCLTEIQSGIAFRARPSEPELQLIQKPGKGVFD